MSGSSTGQIAGFVVGAAFGFFTGGVGFAATASMTALQAGSATVGATLAGASMGYAIGGMIDPPQGPDVPDSVGPKIEGIRNNMPSEGSPINFIMGPQVRIGGNLIWAGEMIERRVEV